MNRTKLLAAVPFVFLGAMLLAIGPEQTESVQVRYTTGGPDAYGYVFMDNINEPTGPSFATQWQDISATGAPLAIIGDDPWTVVTIPILVRMYGQSWGTPPTGSGLPVVSSNAEISANGFVALLGPAQPDPAPGMYVNWPLPRNDSRINPGGFIAVFWDDLDGTDGSAQWQILGAEPNRRLVVQWTNWAYFGGPNEMTFQVQITESDGVQDSDIYFIYQSINATDAVQGGNSATIGIQAPGPTSALQYSVDTANSTTPDPTTDDPRVIRFYLPPPSPNPPDAAANVQQISSTGDILAQGGVTGRNIRFQADVTDPDAGEKVQFEIQAREVGQPWPEKTTFVSSGPQPQGTISVNYVIPAGGNYDWRYRVRDVTRNTTPAAGWTEFMHNGVSPDFMSEQTPPTAPVAQFPDGHDIVASTGSGGPVSFVWDASTDDGPADALRYEIQVSRAADFSEVEVAASDLTALTTSFNLALAPSQASWGDQSTGLPNSAEQSPTEVASIQRYWRVRSTDLLRNVSGWSNNASFRLVAPESDESDSSKTCSSSVPRRDDHVNSVGLATALLLLALIARRRF